MHFTCRRAAKPARRILRPAQRPVFLFRVNIPAPWYILTQNHHQMVKPADGGLATAQKSNYIRNMFADLLKRLSAPEPDPLDDGDARLALAALLIRIAKADGHYDLAEITRIDKVLKSRFNLDADNLASLRKDAEILESEAPDTVRFTRAIKDHVAYEDRVHVIEALWEVALADGGRDYEEDALMRLVAPMLGINDRDSALARQRAQSRG